MLLLESDNIIMTVKKDALLLTLGLDWRREKGFRKESSVSSNMKLVL